VHQHRVVISRAGPLRDMSAKFQSQPIGYLKDRSPRSRHLAMASRFITARWKGIRRGIFIGSLGNERSDKAGPPRPVFDRLEHVPLRGARVAVRLARTLHCLKFWLYPSDCRFVATERRRSAPSTRQPGAEVLGQRGLRTRREGCIDNARETRHNQLR